MANTDKMHVSAESRKLIEAYRAKIEKETGFQVSLVSCVDKLIQAGYEALTKKKYKRK